MENKQWKEFITENTILFEFACEHLYTYENQVDENEKQREFDSICIKGLDGLCHTIATNFFDLSEGAQIKNMNFKQYRTWLKKNYPEIYEQALEFYLDGKHDT